MGHDASKILMGSVGSSDHDVSDHAADPADFPAGVAVRFKSDGTYSVAKSGAGNWVGISRGKSLSDTKRLSIVRDGNFIPVLLTSVKAAGTVTITSYANLVASGDDTISINGIVFTAKASGASGNNQFNAATSNTVTRDNLLAKIQAHPSLIGVVDAVASSTAAIALSASKAGAAGNAITLAYADNGTATVGATVSGAVLSGGDNVAAIGSAVYFDDVTGIADVASGSTISNAVYVSGPKTAVAEDGTELGLAAYIDMAGGL